MLPSLTAAVRRARTGDRCLAVLLLAWTAWVLCSMLWTSSGPFAVLPYLVAPLALLGGVILGRWLSRFPVGPLLPSVLALVAAVVLLAVPFYANAQAAWGLQLLAWAGVLVLHRPSRASGAREWGRTGVVAGMLALLAVLLVARAQATSVLVVPVAFLVLCVVVRRVGPERRTIGVIGLTVVGAAAATVIGLGRLSTWPGALTTGRSLSGARHQLWRDALELWQAHPVTGAGPGGFLADSWLAASTPHLERAHSSVLQVGAELGAVGAVLFLGILMAGAAVALQGSKAAALIGVAAWSALGVHSMIDHLYEFPLVTLTAGIVLGWAGRSRPERDAAPEQ